MAHAQFVIWGTIDSKGPFDNPSLPLLGYTMALIHHLYEELYLCARCGVLGEYRI